jgi:hypothetical protein
MNRKENRRMGTNKKTQVSIQEREKRRDKERHIKITPKIR